MKFRKIVEIESKIEGSTPGAEEPSDPEIPGVNFTSLMKPHVDKFIRIIIEIEDKSERREA